VALCELPNGLQLLYVDDREGWRISLDTDFPSATGSGLRRSQQAWNSIILMSARPAEPGDGHDVIHLGGKTAVVVPLHEYRMLSTLRERASAEEIEEAEVEAAIAEHEAWKAAGRPGGTIPHKAVVAELLGGGQ
jgi:hypothetical protein